MSIIGEGRERHPVGHFIWEHLSEAERQKFLTFTGLTAEEHCLGAVYCALGNVGIGHPMGEDESVEDRHAIFLLDMMSYARMVDEQMDYVHWEHITNLASSDEASAARLRRLYEVASGVSDEETFDEDVRWARIYEYERDGDACRRLGVLGPYDDLPVPVHPALTRWAREGGPVPAVDDDGEQLDLGVVAR